MAVQSAERQFLSFSSCGEEFALDILNVKEIIEYSGITPIPLIPDFICGVINLRGQVVPVIDLAVRFGKDSADITKFSCIVIVEVVKDKEVTELGMVVDGVNEVFNIFIDSIEPTPGFGVSIRPDFVDGVGKHKGQFIIILKVENILDVEELSQLTKSHFTEDLNAYIKEHIYSRKKE